MKITASLLLLMLSITGMALANPGAPAPEIDPGSLVSAAALAGSVLLMFRGRKR